MDNDDDDHHDDHDDDEDDAADDYEDDDDDDDDDDGDDMMLLIYCLKVVGAQRGSVLNYTSHWREGKNSEKKYKIQLGLHNQHYCTLESRGQLDQCSSDHGAHIPEATHQ